MRICTTPEKAHLCRGCSPGRAEGGRLRRKVWLSSDLRRDVARCVAISAVELFDSCNVAAQCMKNGEEES
jgi:hypothetical protein